MTIWAILPAAGIGRRMGSNTPKQYLPVNGVSVISHSLSKLLQVSAIERIVVALHPDDDTFSSLEIAGDDRVTTAIGGDERQQSVLSGLQQLADVAKSDDWVMVHDAVRPCVRVEDIEHMLSELENHEVGGVLGAPADNTLKQVDEQAGVITTVDRSQYWNAHTPQMFRYELLCSALKKAVAENLPVTDEASALELMGHRPQMVLGYKHNLKITHDADLALAAMILSEQEESRGSVCE